MEEEVEINEVCKRSGWLVETNKLVIHVNELERFNQRESGPLVLLRPHFNP